MKLFTTLLVLSIGSDGGAAERADLLVTDFEFATYGDWKVEGNAFGSGPARGTLPGQMHVEGYEGQMLVNSFVGGDDSTGSLTLPPFKIERKHISFLIGGGGHDETAIELNIDGKVVRKASGPNTAPGGSERLDWKTWDVADLVGKTATIRIVDDRQGGWGHINVDQIVQSDRKRQEEPASRELRITKRYLHLPVQNGAAKRRMKFVTDGKTVREFEIELTDGTPDFFVFSDVSPFDEKTVSIEVDSLPADSTALGEIVESDELPNEQQLYEERLRPKFHFTSGRGWLNDPNGLVFYEGEWHLFYQHNPFGVQWGNMHWGHAVSRDLFHWQELPIALYPKEFGDWAFSGSAVVDEQNTSGFGTDGNPPLVLAYTSTGRGECVAYSNDRGRTWIEFDGNPIVKHQGRDPKLVWHEPTQRWVMAVYQEKKAGDDAGGRFIAFYSSSDLKDWTFESRIEGFFECPDLFELKTGGGKESRWVLYAADGDYMLGDFDGKTFTPSSRKQKLWHGNFYAAQSFDHAPEGRRVQIGWARGIEFPHMPFNQQMTVPVELKLRESDSGLRMVASPVKELESLRGQRHAWQDVALASGDSVTFDGVSGDTFDIEATLEAGAADAVEFRVRGVPVVLDLKTGTLKCGDVKASFDRRNRKVTLRMLVDRGSIEVFVNGGEVAVSVGADFQQSSEHLSIKVTGGDAKLPSLVVHELQSAWSPRHARKE
jgi:fructan beta-fructosidase